MSELLTGASYRAVARISDAADVTLAEIGDTCERVPVESLAWLLDWGAIVPLETPAAIPEGEG